MNKHTHKYFKTKLGKEYEIYRCAFPDCPHYLPISLAVGRETICWSCGEKTIIKKNRLLKHPKCVACGQKKKKTLIDRWVEVMN